MAKTKVHIREIRPDDRPHFLVGSPRRVVPSARHACADCGAAVWIAKSGQAYVREGVTILCAPCAALMIQQYKEVCLIRPSRAAMLSDMGGDN